MALQNRDAEPHQSVEIVSADGPRIIDGEPPMTNTWTRGKRHSSSVGLTRRPAGQRRHRSATSPPSPVTSMTVVEVKSARGGHLAQRLHRRVRAAGREFRAGHCRLDSLDAMI